MSRVRIIPVLLLDRGGLYKTIKFKNPIYIGDPINAVKLFNEKEADELILLDYRASAENKAIDHTKIAEIAGEAFMPMAYGGGIRSFEDAKKVFDDGYEKVVLNSILFEDLTVVKKIAEVYGTQAIVASVDIAKNIFGKYKVYSHSGTKSTSKDPLEWTKMLASVGVGEILINNIDRDGTWMGYDLPLVSKIANEIKIPVIVCGGAGSLDDFSKAIEANASAVAAASMFVFQKKGMGVLISFPSNFKLIRKR